jgi:formate/nitrite transporter FocA (FNT family)
VWNFLETVHRAFLAAGMATWLYCLAIRYISRNKVKHALFLTWSVILMFIATSYLFLWILDV